MNTTITSQISLLVHIITITGTKTFTILLQWNTLPYIRFILMYSLLQVSCPLQTLYVAKPTSPSHKLPIHPHDFCNTSSPLISFPLLTFYFFCASLHHCLHCSHFFLSVISFSVLPYNITFTIPPPTFHPLFLYLSFLSSHSPNTSPPPPPPTHTLTYKSFSSP